MISANNTSFSTQRRNSRTPNKLPPSKPSGQGSITKRPVSPINVRSNQVTHHENVIDLNQGFFEFQ